MKYLLYILSFSFIFSACSTDSRADYIDLDIPPEITDKKLIASLKKDEKQLNKVFNSIEDTGEAFLEVCEAMVSIEEDMDKDEFVKIYSKASRKFAWTMTKFTFNTVFFVVREEFEDKSLLEIIEKLSTEEKQAYTKTVKHLKVKKEALKERFDVFMVKLDSMSNVMEEKRLIMETWEKK